MSSDISPANDDGLEEAEFKKWLEADPANQQALEVVMAELAAGKHGAVPTNLRAAARKVFMKRYEQRVMGVISGKLDELKALVQRPPGTAVPVELLRQCRTLSDEITDNLLDMPEPLRTEFLKLFIPMRDKIRAMK